MEIVGVTSDVGRIAEVLSGTSEAFEVLVRMQFDVIHHTHACVYSVPGAALCC